MRKNDGRYARRRLEDRQKGVNEASRHEKDMGETFGTARLQEILGSLHGEIAPADLPKEGIVCHDGGLLRNSTK